MWECAPQCDSQTTGYLLIGGELLLLVYFQFTMRAREEMQIITATREIVIRSCQQELRVNDRDAWIT